MRLGFRKRDARSTRESLVLPLLPPLSNFQRVSRAIHVAISHDVRGLVKDADSDRMRCAQGRRELLRVRAEMSSKAA